MVAGIAAPGPSGIPGFNEAYIVKAGAGGGAANAVPLKSWYNVVISATTAGDSVQLPPAASALVVYVLNNSGQFPNTVANSVNVFGAVNANGVQDTVAGATGIQGTGGTAVAANAIGIFFCLAPQSGHSNGPTAGSWQYKIMA